MVQEKYICPFCSFESNGAGVCPTCDESLQKVCNCGSGKFAADCCKTNIEQPDQQAEEMIKAEVSGEALTEIAQEDEKKIKEEEELENVEEVKD